MPEPIVSSVPVSASVDSYTLPSHSLVGSHDLRMDAGYYNPELHKALDVLRESGMQTECLADISARVFIPPRFKRVYVEPQHGVPFLQGSHIVHFQPADIKYLSRSYHKLEKWTICAGWILVTCSGTIGRTTICPDEWDGWAASQHILRIVPDEEKCPAGYLSSFLSSPLGQVQLTANIYGAVVDELTEQQAKSIVVPLPVSKADKRMVRSVDAAMRRAVNLKSNAVTSANASMLELVNHFSKATPSVRPTPQPEAFVTNPHYEGATPEMVGRALVRHTEPAPQLKDEDQADSEA